MTASLRSIFPLTTGAFVGALGAILWQRSLPPVEGSPEERIAILENDLKKSRAEFHALEDTGPRKRFGASTHDNVRSIAKAIKDGRPVSPDDIFNSFKPLMRDISPLTERINMIESKRRAEARAGEYARRYGLSPEQQKQLVDTLVLHDNEQAKSLQGLLESDHVSMRDYLKATRDFDNDQGIDEFMGTALKGEQRQEFLTQRLSEKAGRVQSEADGQVQRIDDVVKLDDSQRHQVFLYMAQGSRHYNPEMQFDGLQEGVNPLPQGTNSQQAMLKVLRPEQRETYEKHRQERLEKAREDAAQIGLTLPNDWNMDDDIGF